ncbi:MAG: SRPBCC family protein [Bacteroidota bacterium]
MAKTIVSSKQGVTTLQASLIIDAPIAQVWAALKYPGDIKNFHPLVRDSSTMTPQVSGVGCTRHCILLPMGEMVERITAWKEMESFKVEVIDGKMLPPHHFMRGEVALQTLSDIKTRVNFTFVYQLKFGWLGRIMDALLIRPNFKKAPAKYVDGLAEYVSNLSSKRANDATEHPIWSKQPAGHSS